MQPMSRDLGSEQCRSFMLWHRGQEAGVGVVGGRPGSMAWCVACRGVPQVLGVWCTACGGGVLPLLPPPVVLS